MSRDLRAEHAAVMRQFGLGEDDVTAWLASGLGEDRFEPWLVDRVARRPSGSRARSVYGAEAVHDFARRAILEELSLSPADHLLEVGCGGGHLLREALRMGASATGIDHSEEMVDLAAQHAPGARVLVAAAESLPFPDGTFTAVAMSVVFFFFDDPEGVLCESRRVLVEGGRIAIYTTAPELRGTPAAPEPMASHGHFHTDEELVELATQAGFHAIGVRSEDGGQLLAGRA